MISPDRTVRLSADLCATAETKFGRRFATLEELLEFVLREITCDGETRLDESERAALETRLRGLGYL